jgi:cysteine-rich repeat protein
VKRGGRPLILFYVLFPILTFLSACGGGGDSSGDTNPAQLTVSVSPGDGATVASDVDIQLTFSRSMDTSTLSLGGSMASLASSTWSDNATTNDRLVLSPVGIWTEGAGTLTVDVSSADGEAITPLSLNYIVDSSLPVAGLSPTIGSDINAVEVITIAFNEPMDTSTLNASGTLWVNGNGGTWSNNNQTLSLSPTSVWPAGNVALVLDIDDLAGNPITTLNINFMVDATSASTTPEPADSSTIYDNASITLRFSESMSVSTLALGGSLSADADSPVWSQNTVANDTLTLSPATSWSAGSQTIDLTVEDLVGNTTMLSLTYTIVAIVDNDNDGYANNVDCDDNDSERNPGLSETCDGKDNDCDGNIPVNETDADGDGFMVCSGDCSDNDSRIYPTAAEICDGIDNNCSGGIDEGCGCINGETRPCYTGPNGTSGIGICTSGIETCENGMWLGCSGEQTPISETSTLCGNGLDDDCDGNADTADTDCQTCGNLIIDSLAGEECDDGNSDSTDSCVNCQNAYCGDGFVQAGVEECDDADIDDTDGCTSSCQSGFPDGYACQDAGDCLSGFCNASNLCGTQSCLSIGESCALSSECCSGVCLPPGTCVLAP